MAETSYPFLRVARQHGVAYGLVLAYRDGWLKQQQARAAREAGRTYAGAEIDVWERAALLQLGGTSAALAVIVAVKREDARRLQTTFNTTSHDRS